MTKSKYTRQMIYNRKTYVRFPLDLKPEILEAFKAKCKENNTTPTTEIKKFINFYISNEKVVSIDDNLNISKEKQP